MIFKGLVCSLFTFCNHRLMFVCLLSGDGGEGGLSREDMDASIATLDCLAKALEADAVLLRERQLETGLVADFLVRKLAEERDFVEVR